MKFIYSIFICLIFSPNTYADYCDTIITTRIKFQPNTRILNSTDLVVIHENEYLKVISSYQVIKEELSAFLERHQINTDSMLMKSLFMNSDSFTNNLAVVNSDRILLNRLEFRIIDLIEKRNCLIIDKKTNGYKKLLVKTVYSKNCATYEKYSTLDDITLIEIHTGNF